jgi:hypothetical protein
LKLPKTARFTAGIFFSLLLTAPAFAQYGGGSGPSPSYGSGKAAAVGVGAAGAGAGILYLTLRHRSSLTGCVQGGDDDAWSLVDDSKHQTYSLVPGAVALQSGQRVQLKGKKSNNHAGAQTFQVTKVVKTLGQCSMKSAVNSSQSGGSLRNSAEN